MEPEPHEVVERTVKDRGKYGHIYLPVEWIEKRVRIILLDPLEEE